MRLPGLCMHGQPVFPIADPESLCEYNFLSSPDVLLVMRVAAAEITVFILEVPARPFFFL